MRSLISNFLTIVQLNRLLDFLWTSALRNRKDLWHRRAQENLLTCGCTFRCVAAKAGRVVLNNGADYNLAAIYMFINIGPQDH